MSHSIFKAVRPFVVATMFASSTIAAVQAQAGTWDGAYLGLQLGAGKTAENSGGTSQLLGVQVGRDWQVGDWVMGVGIDAASLNGGTGFNDFKALGRLKLRGGYDFGRTLVYATSGASYADQNALGRDWGYFAGVGVEHKLTDNWSLSGEIAQHHFGDFNGAGKLDPTIATVSLNYRF